MAEQKRPGGFGRFWREGVDRLFLGNRGYNYQTGQWDRGGVASGLTQQGLSMIGGPVAGGLYGAWANWDRRRGGDGVPFVDLGGNYEGIHNNAHRTFNPTGTVGGSMAGVYGSRPAGVAGGGPVGVAPAGGLASYVGQIGAGAAGAGNQPGQMPISQVTPDGVGRVQHTVSYMGGRPTFNTGPMALSNMGGARSAFNHGGTVLTGEAARGWMESQKYQPDSYNFRYGMGELAS